MHSVYFSKGGKLLDTGNVLCHAWFGHSVRLYACCVSCLFLSSVVILLRAKNEMNAYNNPFLHPILPLPVSFLVCLFLTSGSGSLFRPFHSVLYSYTILNYSSCSRPFSLLFLLFSSLSFHGMSFSFLLCVLDAC